MSSPNVQLMAFAATSPPAPLGRRTCAHHTVAFFTKVRALVEGGYPNNTVRRNGDQIVERATGNFLAQRRSPPPG